jgi:hypothetical protein
MEMQIKEMYLPWAVDGKWGIEIADGKFKDTVIQIENIEFKDKDSEELLVDYHMVNLAEGLLEKDYKTNEFFELMQLIISDIIAEAVQLHKEEK